MIRALLPGRQRPRRVQDGTESRSSVGELSIHPSLFVIRFEMRCEPHRQPAIGRQRGIQTHPSFCDGPFVDFCVPHPDHVNFKKRLTSQPDAGETSNYAYLSVERIIDVVLHPCIDENPEIG